MPLLAATASHHIPTRQMLNVKRSARASQLPLQLLAGPCRMAISLFS